MFSGRFEVEVVSTESADWSWLDSHADNTRLQITMAGNKEKDLITLMSRRLLSIVNWLSRAAVARMKAKNTTKQLAGVFGIV